MSRHAFRLPIRPAFLTLVMLAALAGEAHALVPRRPSDLDVRVIPAPTLPPLIEPAEEGGTGPGASAAARFRRRHAGSWAITFDRRTGRPSLLEGSGIPLFPGRGNALTAAAAGLGRTPERLEDVEPLGRAFLEDEGDWLRPPTGELRLNPDRSAWLEDGALVYIDYDWFVDGVPVEEARVFVRANSGNIIQAGSARIGAGLPRSTPAIPAGKALALLFEHVLGRRDGDVVVEEPHLLYVARPAGEADVPWAQGLKYHLVWRAAFTRAGEPMTWSGDVDAHTGEVIAFHDRNRYARVTGGIHPRTVTDPEVVRPFPNVQVTTTAGPVSTGNSGTFTYPGGAAFTSLDGPFFRPYCVGCSSPERAFAFVDRGTGDLDLGTGGVDFAGNGASTPAERNAIFHQNRARSVASKWLNIAWLSTTIRTNVNIPEICNAFWNGTANYFRSGGGCNNTGEIADIMYHEWGHGLDGNTNNGDGSTGEATGDIVSMSIVHDPHLGPGFDITGDPVRILDASIVGYQARVDNLDPRCLVCTGQCENGIFGHEVHCEGEIYGQTHWDMAQALVAKHGFNTGWQIAERLFFQSLPQADTMNPSLPQSVYSAYLAVDDDNGNLADGTPNCQQIDNAFRAHGIAGTACAGTTPGCARPPQPSLAVTPGHARIVLDWTASAGAANYRVLRADFSPTQVYLPVGGLQAGTHFEDTTVQPGVTYHYVIEALTAGGCRSTIENAVAASALPDARLGTGVPVVNDIPAGNRSGFADPGESIDLTLPLVNAPPAGPAPAAAGTLSTTTPNVTIANGAASYGAVPVGGAANGTSYRAALGSGLVCGQTMNYTLSIDPGDGTAPTTAFAPILVGQRVMRYFEDFEGGVQTWTLMPGSPIASAGFWTKGIPVPFDTSQTPYTWSWAPGGDAGGGGQCMFTAQNSSDSVGDVDGGETIALSPVIDLSGASAARLRYERWWASSSPTDTGDGLTVEVSGNNGASWVVAESLGAGARTLGWQPVEIRLESLVPLTSTFRMRVKARDTLTDTQVEAAIDNVTIEEVVCDLTPPCFDAPSFAGLASAAPGASCAETDLSWSPANTNCQNAQIRYNVYRSATPGFTPAPQNRVAAGVAGTAFHDTLLQPGAGYHYIVRADDSRSGEDANAVARSVSAPISPDTSPPVFGGLQSAATGTGCGDTTLQWQPALETCSTPVRYNVYRSTSPGFTPGPATLVASVLDTAYVDRALQPQQTYYYKVRGADTKGNEESNAFERQAAASVVPLVVYQESFEAGNGGWSLTAPNDAATGNWEWGDPQQTTVQPEDDATPPPGTRAWITGLQAGVSPGEFDVDTGTTTVVSPILDLTGRTNLVLEMALFFSNAFGANPGEDPYRIDVSGNAGASWTPALLTTGEFAPWTRTPFPLDGVVPYNNQFRIRVTAQDLGVGGSLVEAGFDDVSLSQPGAGCGVCSGPVGAVGTIQVARSGDDIVLDWGADPVNAPAYEVYLRSGPGFSTLVRAGSTTTKSFVHTGAGLLTGQNLYYVVTAVDACGRESAPY